MGCVEARLLLLLFHFLSSPLCAEPRQRTEDRSSSRMLWPSSSASKEVSGSTDSSLYVPTYTLLTPPPPAHLSPPIIVHHVLENVSVRMNHRLFSASRLSSSPLSNEAAAARDSWVSYIASLIPAYAKRSFTLLPLVSSLSISLWRRFALPGRHFLHQLLFPGLRLRF